MLFWELNSQTSELPYVSICFLKVFLEFFGKIAGFASSINCQSLTAAGVCALEFAHQGIVRR